MMNPVIHPVLELGVSDKQLQSVVTVRGIHDSHIFTYYVTHNCINDNYQSWWKTSDLLIN